MATLAPSTWRLLGLSFAAGYAGLGLLEIVFPGRAGLELFLIPDLASKTKKGKSPAAADVHPAASMSGSEDIVPTLMPLLGARDV